MVSNLLTADDVAKQLRIKKYTVYELIKRGELPSSKVGKQVRVSQVDIERYLQSSKTGQPPTAFRTHSEAAPPNPDANRNAPKADSITARYSTDNSAVRPSVQESSIILCGQDACLDLLVTHASESGTMMLRSYMGCYNALYAMYLGKITIASSHLWDGESDVYNYPYIRRLLPGIPVGAVRLAGRMEGLYVRDGNPLGVTDWKDVARPNVTLINRERGCGTRILLDQKLKLAGIDTANIRGYTREATSHLACANIVAKGGADVGCGCARGANVPGVNFVPLQAEWYDLIFRLSDLNTPAIKAIFSYVYSPEFRVDMEMLGGYDLSQTGRYEEF
ncbi:substrate-binding domain-containing protein [Treponema endosymbiont of Eucomonympha sp.]|uniref:substrate-binding domain-containing protein n=1 Tax=Treponema endosymbiont of Eucomonympha sp. TaxID=1580831 RepID=UPI0007510A19|nr:helix-turn-helix transcriptional regulator [Treponema endosymbiont of Eucomonympha sp.]